MRNDNPVFKDLGYNFKGLTSIEVTESRRLNGSNLASKVKNLFWSNLYQIVKEPMFILLAITCILYVMLNQINEAIILFTAILFISGIEIFQNLKSQRALSALNKVTKSKTKCLRDLKWQFIEAEELVVLDVIMCEEGQIVPADAQILEAYDFSINEAIITGESIPINKFQKDTISQGCQIISGYAYLLIEKVGQNTTLGQIRRFIAETESEKTPLQLKVGSFVNKMAIVGFIAFFSVWIYYWWLTSDLINGLIRGLTLTMSIFPEEIPVAFSAFMALGAWRLLKKNIIAHNPRSIEALGSANIICLDKTGTITQNLMQLTSVYDFISDSFINLKNEHYQSETLEYAMLASEMNPFDPMEISIHDWYLKTFNTAAFKDLKMVHEFGLTPEAPIMTHIYKTKQDEIIIASKGSLESVLEFCNLTPSEKTKILLIGKEFAAKGLRVLGVSKSNYQFKEIPESLLEIPFIFLGIVAFEDPIKSTIKEVITGFYNAGIEVKVITGDHLETTLAIAKQAGITFENYINSTELIGLNEADFKKAVQKNTIFTRISPAIKLKIIATLKELGNKVAMTGDGVNDAPALKSAHIGVAMGLKGADVAKNAAGLVISDDNLIHMLDAVYIGRRLNLNLTKAIRYIISIHIPIILIVASPIFIPWLPHTLFSPIHVIFLELLMGPTCSILFENEFIPIQELTRPTKNDKLIPNRDLFFTLIQGFMIFIGCIIAGYLAYYLGNDNETIRTVIFVSLIFSNLGLTLVNRSFTKNTFDSFNQKNIYLYPIAALTLIILVLINYTSLLKDVFKTVNLNFVLILISIVFSFISVFWIDLFKNNMNEKKH